MNSLFKLRVMCGYAILAVFLFICFSYGQSVPKIKIKDIVDIKLLPLAEKFSINDEIVILIKFTIADKYHIYHPSEKKGTPTEVKIDLPENITLENILYPLPILRDYPKIGGKLKLYEGEVYLAAVLRAHSDGDYPLDFTISYGACTNSVCLEPQEKKLSVNVEVDPTGAVTNIDPDLMDKYNKLKNALASLAQASPSKLQPENTPSLLVRLSSLLDHKFMKYLLYLILGIISAFTPCILPVLPITIGWFQTLSQNKLLRYATLISLYLLSSSAIFGFLGMVANTTGGFLGSHLGNFYVVLGLSAFFIFLAYWIMGSFEIPSFNVKIGYGGNVISSILFGSLTGIILSPCVGPILLWILARVAQDNSKLSAFFSLVLYAVGLNIPLIVGSFSVSTIRKIAHTNKLTTVIQVFFSILVLASVIYFSWSDFLRVYGYLAVITIALGFIIKKYVSFVFKGIPEIITKLTSKTNTATFIIFLSLTLGLFGKMVTINDSSKLFNKMTIEDGIVKAKEQNKPLLAKFWAQWCPACLEQKYTLFNDEDVIKDLEKFYLIEIDCTVDEREYCRNKFEQFKVAGLPVIAFYSNDGKLEYVIEGPIEKNKFIEILNSLSRK